MATSVSTHAVWAFGRLTGRVGADWWATEDGTGVDDDDAVGDRDAEAIHAARSWTALLLTDAVVLRTVT
ncbi:MAG: hypothetical protein ACO3VO_10360, partial [Ilumatobacteraceae bacterium]